MGILEGDFDVSSVAIERILERADDFKENSKRNRLEFERVFLPMRESKTLAAFEAMFPDQNT